MYNTIIYYNILHNMQIAFSYWWYRAGKWQIQLCYKKEERQEDPCVVFL